MPDSCVDSDGGVEQYINGSVSGYLNNEFYLNSDFCADAINLVEYSCTGGINKVNTTISCAINATSCSIGVCI